jgi:hypothetical protein
MLRLKFLVSPIIDDFAREKHDGNQEKTGLENGK